MPELYYYEYKLLTTWVVPKELLNLQNTIKKAFPDINLEGMSIANHGSHIEAILNSYDEISPDKVNSIGILIESFVDDGAEDPITDPETQEDKISELKNIINALLGVG